MISVLVMKEQFDLKKINSKHYTIISLKKRKTRLKMFSHQLNQLFSACYMVDLCKVYLYYHVISLTIVVA